MSGCIQMFQVDLPTWMVDFYGKRRKINFKPYMDSMGHEFPAELMMWVQNPLVLQLVTSLLRDSQKHLNQHVARDMS